MTVKDLEGSSSSLIFAQFFFGRKVFIISKIHS